jgi:hypothetical protein
VNFEAENVRAEDGIDSPGEEASSWDPYLVSVVNDTKKPEKKHFSESMSGVLDEMGDTTLGRRATLLRMHEKD